MRLFEWLFVLAFVPYLLAVFAPPTWQPRWARLSLWFLICCGLIQVGVEGWRIRLVPLYMLALGLLALLLFNMTRQTLLRRRLVAFAGLLAVLCGAIFAAWILPVVTLPTPSGPYQVGIVDRELVDQARGRRLMVSIWYPAAQAGDAALLTQHPDEVADALGYLSGLPGIAFQHFRYFKLQASADAAILQQDTPFPVLIFSHGLMGLRLQSSSMLQELASWGYVVVALDHTDAATITVFPDGTARPYDLAQFGIRPEDGEPTMALMDQYVFPAWVADQRFVYDQLEQWQRTDPLFAGRLDLARIGSFGHSFGGATSLEVCRIDPRCQAAANLDGGLYGQIRGEPATRPLLLISSEESKQYTEAMTDWGQLIEQADAPAYWLELPHSNHYAFTITPLLSPLLVPQGYDPQAGMSTIDRYLRQFFDKYLRGAEAPLLTPDSAQGEMRWIAP